MQHQYAQIATEIHAAEIMTYNACRMKEAGLPFVKEASMVKLYSSQVAEKTASKVIEWLGGIGFTKDLLAEKFYRDCKVGSIYEGKYHFIVPKYVDGLLILLLEHSHIVQIYSFGYNQFKAPLTCNCRQ